MLDEQRCLPPTSKPAAKGHLPARGQQQQAVEEREDIPRGLVDRRDDRPPRVRGRATPAAALPSSPEVGSSRKRIEGLAASSTAMARRFRASSGREHTRSDEEDEEEGPPSPSPTTARAS